MQKWKLFSLIVALACVLVFAPVAACHPVLTKTGPSVECPTCEYFEYTITAKASDPVTGLRVKDTLPTGLTFISASPAPTTIDGQKLIWDFFVNPTTIKTITVRVKPASTTLPSVSNFVGGYVMQRGSQTWTDYRATTPVITEFSDEVCPNEVPEFPSMVVPATFVIGLLGMVLYIQSTRE